MFKIIKIIKTIEDLEYAQNLLDNNEKNKLLYTGEKTLLDNYNDKLLTLPSILYQDNEGYYFIFDKSCIKSLKQGEYEENIEEYYKLAYILENFDKIIKIKPQHKQFMN